MKRYIVHIPYVIFFLSLVSTLGSLFFSEVMKLPPCVLCWYQRIEMYPLLVLSAVGILRKDKNFVYYALPLSIAGLITSAYHNLLYYHIIPESVAPCTAGVSCTTKFFEWFGFITIPFMSFVAFALLTFFMIIYVKGNLTNIPKLPKKK